MLLLRKHEVYHKVLDVPRTQARQSEGNMNMNSIFPPERFARKETSWTV
jgi:hypothetical protein